MDADIWVDSALVSGSISSFAVPIEPASANDQAA